MGSGIFDWNEAIRLVHVESSVGYNGKAVEAMGGVKERKEGICSQLCPCPPFASVI